jgi:hypothetical protein
MHTEIIALIRELWPDIKLLLLVSVFSWGISRCFLAIFVHGGGNREDDGS